MAITICKKEASPGKFHTYYLVIAEGINRYTGKRVQKKRRNIASRAKAERIYRELWSLCREERPDGLQVRTWGELKSHYVEFISAKVRSEANPFGMSPKVAQTKISRLKHLREWEDTHLELITPAFVREQLRHMEQSGTSRTMTYKILIEIKCIFGHAVDLGLIADSPVARMKAQRAPRRNKQALTHKETDTLLLEAKHRNHPYYFIWLLTLTTGLRRSELAGLKWSDLDLDNGLIHIRRQLIPGEGLVDHTKSKEERVVAIPSTMRPVLKEFQIASQEEFVINLSCKKWQNGNQSEVLRKFCREIGIKEITHHQLRATYITLAIVDGIPLGIVKENVGHAKLSTTDGYFRSSGVQLRGQLDGLKIRVPQQQEATLRPLRAVK